jgi:iron complex transport system ATP-binding protein
MKAERSTQLLELKDVSAGYREHLVLSGVSTTVGPGELVGLIGPNGAGKTTLLRLMGGTLPARSGQVQLDGHPLADLSSRNRARRIGFVPQTVSISVPYTVEELVAMGRTPYASAWSPLCVQDRLAVERAIDLMDLAPLRHAVLNELSAGEHQRALVATALAQEPDLLLLDEPTAHLDLHHAWQLMKLIAERTCSQRLAVVICLHDLGLAAAFCTRLLLVAQGGLKADGPREAVLREDILSAAYAHPLRVRVDEGRWWIRPV